MPVREGGGVCQGSRTRGYHAYIFIINRVCFEVLSQNDISMVNKVSFHAAQLNFPSIIAIKSQPVDNINKEDRANKLT